MAVVAIAAGGIGGYVLMNDDDGETRPSRRRCEAPAA